MRPIEIAAIPSRLSFGRNDDRMVVDPPVGATVDPGARNRVAVGHVAGDVLAALVGCDQVPHVAPGAAELMQTLEEVPEAERIGEVDGMTAEDEQPFALDIAEAPVGRVAEPLVDVDIISEFRVARFVFTMRQDEERIDVVRPVVVVATHVGAVEIVLPHVLVRPVELARMAGVPQLTVEAVTDVENVRQVFRAGGESGRAEVGEVANAFDAEGRHEGISSYLARRSNF